MIFICRQHDKCVKAKNLKDVLLELLELIKVNFSKVKHTGHFYKLAADNWEVNLKMQLQFTIALKNIKHLAINSAKDVHASTLKTMSLRETLSPRLSSMKGYHL